MPVICEGAAAGRCRSRKGIGATKSSAPVELSARCPSPRVKRWLIPHRHGPLAAKSKPAVEEEAERWLLDDDPPSPVKPVKPPAIRASQDSRAACRREETRRRRDAFQVPSLRPACEASGRMSHLRSGLGPGAGLVAVRGDSPREEDEEDSSPYTVEGADDVQCPECCMMLPPGLVLCVRCGYHLTKRKKVAKTYQPIDRLWDTNGSRQGRLTVFWCMEIFSLVMGLIGVFVGWANLGMFMPFSRTRDQCRGSCWVRLIASNSMRGYLRGRVRLTKTWYVCFFARQPQTTAVSGYEGIASGRHRDLGQWDWLIFFFLILSGVIPGLIWWYFAIHKINFHASLTRDHGYPAYMVYSGWDGSRSKRSLSHCATRRACVTPRCESRTGPRRPGTGLFLFRPPGFVIPLSLTGATSW